jgi:hypothetical protein
MEVAPYTAPDPTTPARGVLRLDTSINTRLDPEPPPPYTKAVVPAILMFTNSVEANDDEPRAIGLLGVVRSKNWMITINNCDSDAKIALCLPPISERVTSETGTSFQYYVLLNQLPTANVTFNVSVSDTNEATVSTATITKTPANWDTVQLITVTGKNDSALEAIGQQREN